MESEKKLRESKYFLKEMKNSKNEKKFRYNLNAFLSSARSITWVLQNEFSKNSNFKGWYEKKQELFRKDPLMKLFTDKRNITIKKGGINSDLQPYKLLMERLPTGEEKLVKVIIPKFKPTNWCFHYIIEENKTVVFRNIIDLSEEYLRKLSSIVKEAKEKFTS